MKVLNNTGEIQTIRVIPRSYPSALTLTLRDDQTTKQLLLFKRKRL
jgi:hypothetical protein